MLETISTNKVWPATEGAAPVLPIANVAHVDRQATHALTENYIAARRTFNYQDIAAPVFVPGIAQPGVIELDKWIWRYPDLIDRKQLHTAHIPYASSWSSFTPFDEEAFPWMMMNQPPVVRHRLAHLSPFTRSNPPYQIQIAPDMWLAKYPDLLPRRKSFISALAPATFFSNQSVEMVIPSISGWLGNYPVIIPRRPFVLSYPAKFEINAPLTDFIPGLGWAGSYPDFARRWASQPHLQPYHFEYELMSPNLALEVTSWLANYPDFARSDKSAPWLASFLEWHSITGPDVAPPVSAFHVFQFRDTRRR